MANTSSVGSKQWLLEYIPSVLARDGITLAEMRTSPNFRALFETAEVRSIMPELRANAPASRGTRAESEMRSMQNSKQLKNLVEELREIWTSCSGKLGTEFRRYCSIEDELEEIAGTDAPNLDGIRDRGERLNAWESHLGISRRTPGAGLQDPDTYGEGMRNAPGPYGRGGGAGPFRSLGEQMQAVIQAGVHGNQTDPRLFQVRAATGMNESVGADGGFVVQSDFTSDIWNRTFEEGRVLSRVNRIQITSNANGIKHPYLKESSRVNGSRRGGLRVYRKAEADSVSSTKPQIGQFSLELQTGMGLVYLTDELMEDAPQLEAFLNTEVPKEIAFSTEDEIFNGNGVGRCMGILNANCLVTVSKEAGQAAGTIVSENVVKMFSRIPASSVPKSAWYVNQQAWPEIFKLSHVIKNVAGTENVGGAPMFIPSGGIASAPQGTLLGRPIIPVEYCSAVGTLGDIVLGDFSQYSLIEKGGVKAASSIHVRFIYGENVLRFTFRNNGAPGYAWADGALTPFKGSDTVSPFVALQTRS